MLYRDLAPITKESWKEIDERTQEVLKAYLSARKVVNVNGPKGLDFNVITEGRLAYVEEKDNICYGNYQVLPLTEARVEFEMERWELDNLNRGAKDVDYEPLEEAAKEIALFEENAVYNGLDAAIIEGLKDYVDEEMELGNDLKTIMESLTSGVIKLREAFVQGPLTLVVGEDAYRKILSEDTGYPIKKRIKDLIGGEIVFSHVVEGAYLLPYNHEDLELTIGRDFSLGYQSHTNERIRFFLTESFTFRVLDPEIIVKFK
jgi:uncharacterized linocin/CFP29 family protein